MSNADSKPVLTCHNIGKSFAGVTVLESVDFDLRPGEVHTLMGENGAGKSTLMKILAGVHRPDSGELRLYGQALDIPSPLAALKLGIALIHQEPLSFPDLDVAENIFMSGGAAPMESPAEAASERTREGADPGEPQIRAFGVPQTRRERSASPAWFVNWGAMYARADALLTQLGVKLDPRAKVRGLSIADQQMVELAAALSQKARVLLMDEPTAALTPEEVGDLFRIVRQLRAQGTAIVFISHRLEEVFAISDRITVLRDGHCIGTRDVAQTNTDEIIRMMVGRELGKFYDKPQVPIGEPRLCVENLSSEGRFADISFEVRRGEILGVAGLVGAGRTDVAQSIFGIFPKDSGTVTLDGEPIRIDSPRAAIDRGIAYVPEDRARHGLLLPLSVSTNTTLARLKQISQFSWINRGRDRQIADEWRDRLRIRLRDVSQPARELSGGNQQKVVLSKWLLTDPQVLMLDEPTRGIDVGAKSEVHHLMGELAKQGKSILMISSDLPEVLAMSDRIIVMREGRITGRFNRDEATQEKIMNAATGQPSGVAASAGMSFSSKTEDMPAEAGRPVGHPVRLRKTADAGSVLFRFRELGIVLFIALAFAVTATINHRFLATDNLRSIALAIPLIVIVAMGQMMVIISRNIDLSVGSVMGLSSLVACGMFIAHPDLSPWIATAVAVGVGALAGLFNGMLVSWLNVPSIIATLGTLSAYRGLTYIYSHGKQVPDDKIPASLVRVAQTSPIFGVPWLVWIAGLLAVVTALWLRYTRVGREIYAIGSNPVAAQLRGVPVRRTLTAIFVITGGLSGLAGMMYASRFGVADPRDTGNGFELIVISATVIGGTGVFGGSGSVLGTVLGCLLLGVITTALPMLNVSPFWQTASYGIAILLACLVDTIIQRKLGRTTGADA